MNNLAEKTEVAEANPAQSELKHIPSEGDVFSLFSEIYDREKRDRLSLEEYLSGCRDNPAMYATAAERMVAAIGEPTLIDTSMDPRLGRIFMNRTLKTYSTMTGFFGMEDTIQRVVSYYQHAAQGLEERKQILYLLGPVGGGKSSLAETSETADGDAADLRAAGRRRDQSGVRIAARPVPPGSPGSED